MARAWKIGTDGDLAIEGGKIALVDGKEAIAQHVAQRLRLFLGEWPLNTEAGFPYRTIVFVKRPSLPLIKAALRKYIAETPGIREVTEVTLSVDPRSRIATGTYSAVTDLGLLEKQIYTLK